MIHRLHWKAASLYFRIHFRACIADIAGLENEPQFSYHLIVIDFSSASEIYRDFCVSIFLCIWSGALESEHGYHL